MSMSLWDHENPLCEIEAAFVGLLHALSSTDGKLKEAIKEEVNRLRIDGHKGAAELLEGKLLRSSSRR